jgi:cobalt-zinc-cadmium efflux system outer membrane protein
LPLALILIWAGPLGAPARAQEPPTIALPPMLTLDESLRLFRAHGLDLLLADAAVASAKANSLTAAAIPNPSLTGAYLYAPGYVAPPGCPTCTAGGVTVGLSDGAAFFDTVWGKRKLRRAVADAALRAAKMSRADAQRTLEFQLKQQYIQAVLARDLLDFTHEVQAAATQVLELNQVRYRAGAISEADVAKVETAKLEADADADRAEQDLGTAKANLAFLLGVRGEVPEFKIEQDLPRFAVPASLAAATRDHLLRGAYENRPDLKAAALNTQSAEAAIHSARHLVLPDIQLQVQFFAQGFESQAINPPSLSFGVALPLPFLYQYQGEVTQAEAQRRAATIGLAKLEAQVAADVETGFRAYAGTRRRVERMEGGLLAAARRARDLAQIQYQKGAASLLEFLDAQRTFISINVEYLRDLADFWTAVFQLEQAVGTELRR